MIPPSIIGVFCEDIRVEAGDIFTLVGLIPDTINVESASDKKDGVSVDSKMLAKLCIFTRANFDPDDPIKEIELRLIFPNEEKISIGGAASDVIERAKRQAKENGGPLAGVIMRSVLQQFRLSGPGILKLEATMGAETRLIAFLNFRAADSANPSIASAQQS